MKKHPDYRLMRSVHETCGHLISHIAGDDLTRSCVLAALTANGSGGSASAYRFSPLLFRAFEAQRKSSRSGETPVSRRQLEGYAKKFANDVPEDKLIRNVAAFHGYTLIAGYHCVRWKIPLEELTTPAAHFVRADQLLAEYCAKHGLVLKRDLAQIGHLWISWRGLRNSAVSMYIGRLRMRFEVYYSILTREKRRAA